MIDSTEPVRRVLQQAINAELTPREVLEEQHGEVWNTEELQEAFTVTGFMAPFVVVVRKSDGVKGSMMFQGRPRFYWGFDPA